MLSGRGQDIYLLNRTVKHNLFNFSPRPYSTLVSDLKFIVLDKLRHCTVGYQLLLSNEGGSQLVKRSV
jgi:hypothetical protein